MILFFNNRVTPNRYNYTYRIIQEYLNGVGCKSTFQNIENGIPKEDKPTDDDKKVFIFLNQCMSHFFGDNKWYPSRENDKDIYNIKEIRENGNDIAVLLDNGDTIYKYSKDLKLKCAKPTDRVI